MKKIFLLSAVALMTLAACDDYEDQFNLDNQITDVKKGTEIVLADADYATIAGLPANKALAAKLDEASGTTAYTEALGKLGKQKYFNEFITPDQFIPAFISTKYKEADAGSRFKVTYNVFKEKSAYLADFDKLKGEYTLTAEDYSEAWGGASSAKYLTPKTESKLKDVLKKAKADAAEGDIVVVNYAFSDFEPAGGGEAPAQNYNKISEVVANTEGGEYSVKGIVCATYKTGFLLYDKTGYILVYKASDVNVGDEVAVTGTTTKYGGLMQFPAKNTELNIELVKKGKEPNFKHPSAKTYAAADFEAYAEKPVVEYITYKGNLSITTNSKGNKYYNVTIDGTEKQGSLANVPDGLVDENLNGKNIVVYGYSIGATGTDNKFLNTMVVSCAEATAAGVAKAKAIARATANGGVNRSVVYRFDGKAWKVYSVDKVDVIAAQPEWYALIGQNTVSKPATYFPALLQREYPFAKDEQKAAVVYRKSDTEMAVVEFNYTVANGWTQATSYVQESATFVLQEAGFKAIPNAYYSNTFLDGDGGFTIYDIERDASLSYIWQITSQYGWKGGAFNNSTKKCTKSESWIVSPTINLTNAENPEMVFDEAMNKMGTDPALKVRDYIKVMVSTNFEGDVKAAKWDELEVQNGTNGNSWDFVTVTPISLVKYIGKPVHIAFKYLSTEAVAPTYEVKNLVVSEHQEEEAE